MAFSCFSQPKVDLPKGFKSFVPMSDSPALLEGVQEINTLCPVNKLTGKRCNPIQLLSMVAGGKVNERVLAQVLQELPQVAQDTSMNDAQRFEFVSQRLMTGTPSEDALVSERLFACANELGIDTSNLSRDAEGKVIFEGNASEVENVDQEIK